MGWSDENGNHSHYGDLDRYQEFIVQNHIKILVIEDRANHVSDAKQMFDDARGNMPVEFEVVYAEDLTSAMPLIDGVDCVMTDVFFPDVIGGEEKPNGQIVAGHCLNVKKPVVMISSTYHHGRKTQPVCTWGRDHGLEIFDCNFWDGDMNREGEHKPWKHALIGILSMIVGLEMGKFHFLNGKLEGDHDSRYYGEWIEKNYTDESLDRMPVLKRMKELFGQK